MSFDVFRFVFFVLFVFFVVEAKAVDE